MILKFWAVRVTAEALPDFRQIYDIYKCLCLKREIFSEPKEAIRTMHHGHESVVDVE